MPVIVPRCMADKDSESMLLHPAPSVSPQDTKNNDCFGQKLHSHLQGGVPLALTQWA